MTSQFKVGDKVTIDNNLKIYNSRQIPFATTDEMVALKGRQATITEVIPPYNYDPEDYPSPLKDILDGAKYRINIDNERWVWCNAMFKQTTNFLKVVEEEL